MLYYEADSNETHTCRMDGTFEANVNKNPKAISLLQG